MRGVAVTGPGFTRETRRQLGALTRRDDRRASACTPS